MLLQETKLLYKLFTNSISKACGYYAQFPWRIDRILKHTISSYNSPISSKMFVIHSMESICIINFLQSTSRIQAITELSTTNLFELTRLSYCEPEPSASVSVGGLLFMLHNYVNILGHKFKLF
jgi:hypothetical protein